MKLLLLSRNASLFFSILTILFNSCIFQNNSQTSILKVNNQNPIAKVPMEIGKKMGDSVKVLGNNLMIIMQDKNNNYWFGSNGEGVYRYNPSTGVLIQFTTKDGLCSNQIGGIQEDKSGMIYFTTSEGICKFDGHIFTKLSITNNSNNEWILARNDFTVDELWFTGAQDSALVYRYDGKTLNRLKFPKTTSGEEFIASYPRSKYPNMTFSPYDVYCIYRDRSGNIWFGTGSLGVCKYDGKSFTWIAESKLSESPVRSIFEDKDGSFWFGNSGQAVYRYDGQTLKNIRKENGIGNAKDMEENAPVSYMSIIEDNNDVLWIATFEAGVWRYDGKKATHFRIKDGNTKVTLFSIFKDKLGEIWLGTHTSGVYKFNGKSFEKFEL